MSRVAYILANDEGIPYADVGYAAWYGFAQLDYDVRLYQFEEFKDLSLTHDTIVVGGVGFVHDALDRLGVPRPPEVNIPTELLGFAGRKVWESTLAQARKPESWPIFIKPLRQAKAFVGHVIRDWPDLITSAGWWGGMPVLAQEPVVFLSEWRVYVCRGKVLGMGNYRGDPFLYPDRAVVMETMAAWDRPFVAYGIDFGVTDTGRTLLIEINEGHSLGNYNLRPVEYARLLEARWEELMATARTQNVALACEGG